MSGIAYDELGTRLRLYKGISGNAAAAKDSLKILVLHGFGSTAEACKRQVRPLFDSLDTVCELHFIDGMHEAPQLLAMMFGSSSGNAWWSMHPSSQGKGYSDSVRQLIDVLELEPKCKHSKPFDGILGFSQGAAMVAMLVAEQAIRNKSWFKFACCISGFIPSIYEMKNTIDAMGHKAYVHRVVPSWHSFGANDIVIQKERSFALAQKMNNSTICDCHAGGHEINVSDPRVLQSFGSFVAGQR